MINGTTDSGFAFEINEEDLDDMELIEDLAGLEQNTLLMPKVLNKMLGEEQKKRLYDHVRDGHGRARYSALQTELANIMQKSAAGKK